MYEEKSKASSTNIRRPIKGKYARRDVCKFYAYSKKVPPGKRRNSIIERERFGRGRRS